MSRFSGTLALPGARARTARGPPSPPAAAHAPRSATTIRRSLGVSKNPGRFVGGEAVVRLSEPVAVSGRVCADDQRDASRVPGARYVYSSIAHVLYAPLQRDVAGLEGARDGAWYPACPTVRPRHRRSARNSPSSPDAPLPSAPDRPACCSPERDAAPPQRRKGRLRAGQKRQPVQVTTSVMAVEGVGAHSPRRRRTGRRRNRA